MTHRYKVTIVSVQASTTCKTGIELDRLIVELLDKGISSSDIKIEVVTTQ